MVGAIGATIFFVLGAANNKPLQVEDSTAAKGQQAHVDKPLIVERKSGKMIWRLKAQKAEQELRGSMHLIQPELELFSDAGKRIPVSGKQAWFDPLNKAINFKQGVVVRYGEWTLFADEVRYEHGSNSMHIPGTFRIEGKLTRGRGEGLTVWRDDHHVRIEKGVWLEDRHPYAMQVKP